MWMTSIASVVLKYVWLSAYVLEGINKKLTLIVPNPPSPKATHPHSMSKIRQVFRLSIKITTKIDMEFDVANKVSAMLVRC